MLFFAAKHPLMSYNICMHFLHATSFRIWAVIYRYFANKSPLLVSLSEKIAYLFPRIPHGLQDIILLYDKESRNTSPKGVSAFSIWLSSNKDPVRK